MAATASVAGGSGSYSEDQFGKKIDRCITDTLVKAGMYERIRIEKLPKYYYVRCVWATTNENCFQFFSLAIVLLILNQF